MLSEQWGPWHSIPCDHECSEILAQHQFWCDENSTYNLPDRVPQPLLGSSRQPEFWNLHSADTTLASKNMFSWHFRNISHRMVSACKHTEFQGCWLCIALLKWILHGQPEQIRAVLMVFGCFWSQQVIPSRISHHWPRGLAVNSPIPIAQMSSLQGRCCLQLMPRSDSIDSISMACVAL